MNILKQDMKRLDNIAKAYWKTSGEIRADVGHVSGIELIKQIGR